VLGNSLGYSLLSTACRVANGIIGDYEDVEIKQIKSMEKSAKD